MEQDELKGQENTHGHDACNSNNSTNKLYDNMHFI